MIMEYAEVLQWIGLLFLFTIAVGVVAPIGGVGGGVLFVPLVTAFFPFSVDFIRGAGLIVALTSSLFSAPYLIQKGLANVKIMYLMGVVSIVTSIVGGVMGLWITNAFASGEAYFTIALGVLLFIIFVLMITSKRVEFPLVKRVDRWSRELELKGAWYEHSMEKTVEYQTTNIALGMVCFGAVGFVAGMFGLGAGWASVPVLNLVMGAPIKVSVATSMAIITVNSAAASWVYIAKGATLPLICIPSVVGTTIGARIGSRVSERARPVFVKYLVMGIMVFAAVLDIFKGLRGAGII